MAPEILNRGSGAIPDIYADGYQIAGGPTGITLSLLRSEPTGEPGPHEEPSVIVARVRMSTLVAQQLTQALAQTFAGLATMQPPPQGGPKN